MEKQRTCYSCGKFKNWSEFYLFKGKPNSRRCKSCEKADKKGTYTSPQHREKVRERQLQKDYGITLAEYRTVLAIQGGTCAICKRLPSDKKSLATDHDHSTGNLRGLLCDDCNRGIGLLQESPMLLRKACSYLEGSNSEIIEAINAARKVVENTVDTMLTEFMEKRDE